jgi:hypothetical protein
MMHRRLEEEEEEEEKKNKVGKNEYRQGVKTRERRKTVWKI